MDICANQPKLTDPMSATEIKELRYDLLKVEEPAVRAENPKDYYDGPPRTVGEPADPGDTRGLGNSEPLSAKATSTDVTNSTSS